MSGTSNGESESDVFKMRATTQVNSQGGDGRHTGGYVLEWQPYSAG